MPGGSIGCAGSTLNFDYIRLDHFRGFSQFWEIPADEPTAIHGRWVDGPKDDLFEKAARNTRRPSIFCRGSRIHHARCARSSRTAANSRHGGACSLVSETPARTLICRTRSRPRKSSTPAPTITIRCLAGGHRLRPRNMNVEQVAAYLGRCDDGVNWAMIRAASIPRQPMCCSDAGCARSGQRSAHECPQQSTRQLAAGVSAAELLRPELAAKLALLAEVSDRLPQPLQSKQEDWAA